MAPTASPDFSTGWPAIADSLIGGIAHALSNRIATLGALGELMRLGDDASEVATMLPQETRRLEEIVASLRLLGNEAGLAAEALEPRELLDRALALHAFHRDLRGVELEVDAEPRVPPVRIERRCALHAVLMLLAASSVAAAVRQGLVRVHLAGDDATVRLTFVVPGPGIGGSLPDALLAGARSLITPSGGVVASDDDEIVLELPSLGALRAAERPPPTR